MGKRKYKAHYLTNRVSTHYEYVIHDKIKKETELILIRKRKPWNFIKIKRS